MTPSEEIRQQLPGISEETAEQMAETARRAGVSAADAVNAITAAMKVVKTAAEIAAKVMSQLTDTIAVIVQDSLPDVLLQTVATPKEWHLMNHARKARTRKKYRNRLTRRLIR